MKKTISPRLNLAGSQPGKKQSPAQRAGKTAAAITAAQAQVKKPLGTRAAAASQGHWIGPATQGDHELLWRLNG
jgi:hypothetical protein